MNKEIKEILEILRKYDFSLDIPKEIENKLIELFKWCEEIDLLYKKDINYYKNCITNLQQENEKLKEKFNIRSKAYNRILLKNSDLNQENERLKECYCNRTDCSGRLKDSKKYDSVYQEKEIYKSKCEGTINLIDRTIEIIKQQPTKDDSWILSRLYGFKYALNGSDEKSDI